MGWTFTHWIQKLQTGVMALQATAMVSMLYALHLMTAYLTCAPLNSYSSSPPTVGFILS